MCTLKGKHYINMSASAISFGRLLFKEHDTHSCSCVWKRPQNSRSCRRHNWGPRCCKGTSCTRRSACHKRRCPTYLCCCCTGTAGSALRAERGCRSNPGHIPHIGHLMRVKKQIIITSQDNENYNTDTIISSLLLFQLNWR